MNIIFRTASIVIYSHTYYIRFIRMDDYGAPIIPPIFNKRDIQYGTVRYRYNSLSFSISLNFLTFFNNKMIILFSIIGF